MVPPEKKFPRTKIIFYQLKSEHIYGCFILILYADREDNKKTYFYGMRIAEMKFPVKSPTINTHMIKKVIQNGGAH